MVEHVTTEADYEALKATRDALVVVDFSAVWCGPCRFVAPKFDEFSQRYSDAAVFVHVDIDELADLPDCQDVQGVPTFKFFRNGELLDKFSGANVALLESTIVAHL